MQVKLPSETAPCGRCSIETEHNVYLEIYPDGREPGKIYFRRRCSGCNFTRTNTNPSADVENMLGYIKLGINKMCAALDDFDAVLMGDREAKDGYQSSQ